MKFQVSRVSDHTDKEKPCNGAVPLEVYYHDGTPRENHGWSIELNSFEEMLKLMDEVDQDVIVSREAIWAKGMPNIYIYDDYYE
jgi:hypothetical protein